jgi:hypothetical protein
MRDRKETTKENQTVIVREVDQESYKERETNKKNTSTTKKNLVHLHHHLFPVLDPLKNCHRNLDY